MQATTNYDTPESVEIPQIMGNYNTHNMNTLHITMLRTSTPKIRNYADRDGKIGTGGNFRRSHAPPCHISTAQVITQLQKVHDSFNVQSDWFNMQYL